jgi:transposase-like protein
MEVSKYIAIFSHKDILRSICDKFFDEQYCRMWILSLLYSDYPLCPECGMKIPKSKLQRFWNCQRIRCGNCGKFFTALTGTFLSGCHMDFRKLILLAIFLECSFPTKEIAERLHVSAETIRIWKNKFETIVKLKEGL